MIINHYLLIKQKQKMNKITFIVKYVISISKVNQHMIIIVQQINIKQMNKTTNKINQNEFHLKLLSL